MTAPRPAQTPSGPVPTAAGAEDAALVARAVTGDRIAFEALHRRHVNRVYGTCLRLTADPGEAEILVQDTFVKAWFALAGYTGQGPLGAWLARVAVNQWRDRLRASKRSRQLAEDFAHEANGEGSFRGGTGAGGQGATRGGVIPLLTAVDLERAIARLPRAARTAYVLYDVEGYTHREVGELLGVATGTVKAHVHRARRLLRTMLSERREADHGA